MINMNDTAIPFTKEEAHQILNLAKAGADIPLSVINVCLAITGDLT